MRPQGQNLTHPPYQPSITNGDVYDGCCRSALQIGTFGSQLLSLCRWLRQHLRLPARMRLHVSRPLLTAVTQPRITSCDCALSAAKQTNLIIAIQSALLIALFPVQSRFNRTLSAVFCATRACTRSANPAGASTRCSATCNCCEDFPICASLLCRHKHFSALRRKV